MWLAVVGCWVFGFVIGRWHDTYPFFMEISKAVRVPDPSAINTWWNVIAYFALSTVSLFVLSHILFGVGGGFFLFSRGMYDSVLFGIVERKVSNWSISDFSLQDTQNIFVISTVLVVNLPLCLWASQLGMQRSFYTLNRIRGEPINPELGSEPISDLLRIIAAALVTGLLVSILLY